MAKQIVETFKYCPECEKKTLHQYETTKINWLMHIALMFALIGFITLTFALIGRALTGRIAGGKSICSKCGLEH